MDLWALPSHLLVKSWSAQSHHLHYFRYLYCTTLTLAHLVKIQQSMRFSFLFFVENSICHNLQAHSQYKTVLSSIRSIIHQCCESGTGKMFFWEIPMLTWKECWECVQKHVILHSHLQCKLAPMIHISQYTPHPSSLFFPRYFWRMPGCGSDTESKKNNDFKTAKIKMKIF